MNAGDEAVRSQPVIPGLSDEERVKAAALIQKTYRGHRTRRALNGFGLDASTRWYEAVKDAQFRERTAPQPPVDYADGGSGSATANETHTSPTSPARTRWKHVTEIARRAGADDDDADSSPSQSDVSEQDNGGEIGDYSIHKPSHTQRRRQSQDADERRRAAKMMDLQYFLELVDHKHRYGSSLRKYHNYWKTQDTNQSFFYWLDHGDGREVELPECSRERLDREQVRYLSREERLLYQVKINHEGLLVWAKNDELVWTRDELYRDSVEGIVPISDPAPEFQFNVKPSGVDSSPASTTSSSELDDPDRKAEDDEESKAEDDKSLYVNEEFHQARGLAKMKHFGPSVIFNHMIRKSIKRGHKWIFCCDSSMRLYVGYKQSGSFQHSSFLHGARILAAGLIKIKRGVLKRLSPLSGHYRPRTTNFRAFVHGLRDAGCDMSHVSISRSYAVLVGLETYTHARNKISSTEHAIASEKEKLLHPDQFREEEEAKRDKSQSAEKERLYLAQLAEDQRKERQEAKANRSLGTKLSHAVENLKVWDGVKAHDVSESTSMPQRIEGTGPEDGIPAPDGKR